ncbi:MAG: GNAT family N-acetyltransferase [Butyricicoccus sp.]|nr:GNAT family N-acetyltransferase [Butyricicoccus sp.]
MVAGARRHLKKHGIDQWQGGYPNEESFAADIARGECHIVTYGGESAGFFTLTRTPEEGYEHLADGRWSTAGPYCALHRLAVATRFRGSDMSRELMRAALELARSYDVGAVRADTHKKNKSMRALLAAFGFTYRGNVLVASEPGHDPRRQAYDLPLAKG